MEPTAWHTVGMDLMGLFPTSQDGRRYVLVCIDYLIKWIKAKLSVWVGDELRLEFCPLGEVVSANELIAPSILGCWEESHEVHANSVPGRSLH